MLLGGGKLQGEAAVDQGSAEYRGGVYEDKRAEAHLGKNDGMVLDNGRVKIK